MKPRKMRRATRKPRKALLRKRRVVTAEAGVRSVSRWYCANDLYLSTLPGQPVQGAYAFSPVQMQDWNIYAQLYSQYKLSKITMVFEPTYNSNLMISATDPNPAMGPATAQSLYNGRLITVINTTDTVPLSLTNKAAVLNDRTARWTPFTKTHTRTFVPAYPDDVNGSPLTTETVPINPWVATGTPITDYLGLQYYADDWFNGSGPQSQPLRYRVYIRYTVLFRRAK